MKQWMTKAPIAESPQDALGWRAFFMGYISNHWVEQQDTFYNETGRYDCRRHNGHYWSKHLIHFLWQQARKLWKERNEKVHEPDQQERDSPQERKTLQNKIRILYGSATTVREADRRNFFNQKIEDVIDGPTIVLRAWITTNGPPIKRAIQDAVILSRHNCRDIRDFFIEQPRAPT